MLQDGQKPNRIVLPNSVLIPKIISLIEEGHHTVTLRMSGWSMQPFLDNNRDIALLAKVTSLHVGDAVLAEISPKKYVFHRIIKIDGDDVTLQGDGNISKEYCKVENIKAIGIGFYRKGRKILDSTDGYKWKIYSWIWMHIPLRRYLLAVYRRIWIPITRKK
ncbi:peptidase S24-like protein [Prevotella sp. DNF00663]|uniref:S24/S26 family peptidase n=1 Tax=Prevotella sp. DNF00663 TaxID=1384078 RepID=UPI0007835A3F|nr:S24/S26 family peptidase [Prevotella sp. DNF00663]KXB83123.1 peptidase S24-like protein [Prevotella sp. DNF00663]